VGTSLFLGAGIYKFLSTYKPAEGGMLAEGGDLSWLSKGNNPLYAGGAVALVTFALNYKDEDSYEVTFDCKPWEAPRGGALCEVCNDDELECSEYRCQSLGTACELVNEGTDEELCVNMHPKDVTPPTIRPNLEVLSEGYGYENVKSSPPGPGFEIKGKEGKCVKAFTPLVFGVTLNEPGQCRVSINSTDSYDEMQEYFGGNSFFAYNHTEVLTLPNAEDIEGSGIELENGNEMTLFVRCVDKAGNENEAEYGIGFCVDDEPDATAPRIEDVEKAYGLFYDSQREIRKMIKDANFRIVSEDGSLVDVEDLEMSSEADRLAKMKKGVVVGFSVDEESGVCRMRIVGDGEGGGMKLWFGKY
jgi:hypothetical protein